MSAQIKLHDTSTRVRGGGFGADAWIARITGPCSQWSVRREFCARDTSGLSGSGKSGYIRFDVTEPGLYEFRKFCVGSTARNWEWSGFVRLHADGMREFVSRASAVRIAKGLEAESLLAADVEVMS